MMSEIMTGVITCERRSDLSASQLRGKTTPVGHRPADNFPGGGVAGKETWQLTTPYPHICPPPPYGPFGGPGGLKWGHIMGGVVIQTEPPDNNPPPRKLSRGMHLPGWEGLHLSPFLWEKKEKHEAMMEPNTQLFRVQQSNAVTTIMTQPGISISIPECHWVFCGRRNNSSIVFLLT